VLRAVAQNITTGAPGANCTGTGVCVSTYHNDNFRDGVNSNEIALKPSLFNTLNPLASNFGLVGSTPSSGATALDGLVYGQPLYLTGVQVNTLTCSGTYNLVLVATENNSVYAFRYDYSLSSTGFSFSLTQCWMLNLNKAAENAIAFTNLPQQADGSPCNNVVPQSGITSTPVIDTTVTPPVMYVVTGHQLPAPLGGGFNYKYRLHAILTNSGTETANGYFDLGSLLPSSLVSPTMAENQRPGLALFPTSSAAYVYVAFGSFCDIQPYSGFLMGLSFNNSSQTFSTIATSGSVFNTEAGEISYNQHGGIWMGGAAPAVDGNGNVYLAVGNGTWNGAVNTRATNFGESVIKIATSTSSGLTAVDYYTPNDAVALDNGGGSNGITLCSTYSSTTTCPTNNMLTLKSADGDQDLGSGGVTLITPQGVTGPACGSNQELVAGGKEGVIYGLCYSTQTSTTPQTLMGGLDGCGYGCLFSGASTQTITGCSQSTTPGSGYIVQCFEGVNAGEPNEILPSPGIHGTEAFWAGTSSSPQNYLYVAGVGSNSSPTPMMAYQISTSNGAFGNGWKDNKPTTYPYPGPVPAISWDGSTSGSGLLWVVDAGGYGRWDKNSNTGLFQSYPATPAVLIVYIAVPTLFGGSTVLEELWSSNLSQSNSGPGAVKFTVPTVANGLVFVAGGVPGYAPGQPGGTNVNCTATALINTSTPTACQGMLSVYGKIKSQ
jgi:hypothetical protein